MASDWVHGDAIILGWGLEDFELNALLTRGELEAYDPITGKRYVNIDSLEKRIETSFEQCLNEQYAKRAARTISDGMKPPHSDAEIKEIALRIYKAQQTKAIIPDGCIAVSFKIHDDIQQTTALFNRNRRAAFKCKETVDTLLRNGFQPIQLQANTEANDTQPSDILNLDTDVVVDGTVGSPDAAVQAGVGQDVLASTAYDWRQIHLIFVGDSAVEIHCAGTIANKTFDEIGFSDNRRKEEPNSLWVLLKLFAESRGEIVPDDDITKQISNLRKSIKYIFPHISGDPIRYNNKRRAYTTVFGISSRIPRE